MNILNDVREFDPYFKLKHDVVGTARFSLIQKYCRHEDACIRISC
jgi:hypothetical protein